MVTSSEQSRHGGKVYWAVLLVASCCLIPGCRTARDNQIELLERELRTQEDYIYELEDYVVQYSERLRSLRCAQAVHIDTSPSSELSVVKKSPTKSEDLKLDTPPPRENSEGTLPPPTQTEPEVQPFDLDEFEPPPLNIEEQQGRVKVGTTDGLVLLDEAPVPLPIAKVEPAVLIEPMELAEVNDLEEDTLSAPVTQVVYYDDSEDLFEDQQLEDIAYDDVGQDTGVQPIDTVIEEVAEADIEADVAEPTTEMPKSMGIAQLFRNEEPGLPKSMLVVVEGYDAQKVPTGFTGDVSLMVILRSKQRPTRLKRWDFDPDDVSAAWQESHLGRGLHLELPLEETKLPDVPLELWVRLVDEQGDKLLVRRPFQTSLLAGLEVDTGAKELMPESEPPQATEQIAVVEEAEQEAEDQEPEGIEAKPATEQVAAKKRKPSKSGNSGWRSSTVRTDATNQGFASTIKRTSGWTSQKNSGSYQSSNQAPSSGPVWTAGSSRPLSSSSQHR